VARIISAQLTARLPSGMLSLAILIHIEGIFDSYGAAGLVLAATSVGQAIAGPLTSRWMGALGMRPVLIATLVICATALSLIALVVMPIWLYMIVGFIAGISTPPIQPAVRTIYPKMVTSRQLTPLFSLDASAQEIIWIMGPVLTVVLATQVSSVVAITVAAAKSDTILAVAATTIITIAASEAITVTATDSPACTPTLTCTLE
jgi:MFS family permease